MLSAFSGNGWFMIATQFIMVVLVAAAGAATAGEKDSKPAAAKLPRFAVRGSWNGIAILTTLIQRYDSDRQTHLIDFMPADSDQIPGLLAPPRLRHGHGPRILRLPEKAKESADRFENMTLGWFIVCVAVNAKSPVRTITLDDLRGVFAGKILLWQGVRGSGATGRIEPYHAAAFTTQGMLFQKKVLLGQRYVDRPMASAAMPRSGKKSDAKAGAGKEGRPRRRPPRRREKETDAGVIGAVIKQPNAIGFILLSFRWTPGQAHSHSGHCPQQRRPAGVSIGRDHRRSQLSVGRFAYALSASRLAGRGQEVLQVCRGAEGREEPSSSSAYGRSANWRGPALRRTWAR